MPEDMLDGFMETFRNTGVVLVATSDPEQGAYVAAARRLETFGPDRLSVQAWWCDRTVANLDANPRLSLVVWDPQSGSGYQLLGECQGVENEAWLDGLAEGERGGAPLPQVERNLVVRVRAVFDIIAGVQRKAPDA